ncbi:MAG: hypothetical protein ACRDQ1_12455, partial [Sciscionella sp.]
MRSACKVVEGLGRRAPRPRGPDHDCQGCKFDTARRVGMKLAEFFSRLVHSDTGDIAFTAYDGSR